MKRIITLYIFLLIMSNVAAQNNCTNPPSAREELFVNRLRLKNIQPGASIGDFNEYGGAVEADFNGNRNSVAAVWGANFWIGGLDTSGNVKVSAQDVFLPQNGFRYVTGPKTTADCSQWDRFWSVERPDLLQFRTDIADGTLDDPAEAILSWPGNGNPYFSSIHGFDLPEGDYAPFFDADQDGIYDPYKGDFPQPENTDTSIVPGRILWSLFHDANGTYADGITGLGFEYQQTIWAISCQDTGVLNEALFFSLRIKNTSGQKMDAVIAGIQTNKLFGNMLDDYFGTDTALQTLYFYNSRITDDQNQPFYGKSYGANPPAAAWTLFNKPLYKTMYYFRVALCDPNVAMLEASNVSGYYNILNGRWKNGQPLINSGEGFSPTWNNSQLTDFVFTGSVFVPTSWNMISNYVTCSVNAAPLFTVNLGTLQPNQSETIDYAYSFHRDTALNNLQQIPRMFGRISQLREMYAHQFKNTCAPQQICTDDCVWPGDTNHDGIVNYRDIIPIGLMLGKTGPARTENNSWGPKHAENWGQQFDNQFDIKHADCNGDGLVDTSDLALVRRYLYHKTPDYQPVADTFQEGDEIALNVGGVIGSLPGNVKTEDRFLVRPFLGVNLEGLRALAVDFEFDSAYWSVTPAESLTVDSFKISYRFVNDSASTQVTAWLNSDFQVGNFGVILPEAKAIQPNMPKETMIRLKNIEARLADGTSVQLGSWPFYFCFGGGCATSSSEPANPAVQIYPQPSTGSFFVDIPNAGIRAVKIFNVAGQVVDHQLFGSNGGRVHVQTSRLKTGFYMVEITTADHVVVRTGQVFMQPIE